MPSIYEFKPRFQRLLQPLSQRLVVMGWTANHVTILAMILSAVAGACILVWHEQRWPLLALPFVLVLRMALNAIDGMMARQHDMQTALGAILNELGDVLSDTVLYLPFAVVAPLPAVSIVLIVILSVISEMTGIVAIRVGSERRYDGPMGKSDRAFVFGLLGLSLGLGFAPQLLLQILLTLVVLLLAATIFNRARGALNSGKA